MSDINSVALSGRLTRDPELRTTTGGTSVMSARLAFDTYRKTQAGGENVPNFVDLVAFGNRADFYAGKLSKGSLVFVDGRLSWSEWDGQDGTKRQKLEVIVDELKSPDLFNSNGGGSRETTGGGNQYVPADSAATAADDDIPF